ncbi:MAG TPA: IS1595 family transposase [Stellaceae bacterium]|nr:IS1595 family transposase [Stellaceae bacterium]
MNLTDPIFTDERRAREFFEASRWPDGKPACPHCGCTERVYRLHDADTHRDGLFHCNDCAGAFTVTTGTVMESSHIPLNKWALVYRLMTSAKKGISAHQVSRTIGVSYKTAWFMCHRVRESMRDATGGKLGGPDQIVEADETYVGGKPRRGTDGHKTKLARKTPVAILVERDGRARATVMDWPIDGAIKRNIKENVAAGTEMHTDQHKAYRGVEKITGAPHQHVNHTINEYEREGVHSNTAESWNALLKRSIVGSFHHVSREHLSRYCDEVSFRWDRRTMNDSERTIEAIKGGEGKRLTYRRTHLSAQG